MHACSVLDKIFRIYQQTIDQLNLLGEMIPPLLLRLILAIEFGRQVSKNFTAPIGFRI